jgi:hypothetical protein
VPIDLLNSRADLRATRSRRRARSQSPGWMVILGGVHRGRVRRGEWSRSLELLGHGLMLSNGPRRNYQRPHSVSHLLPRQTMLANWSISWLVPRSAARNGPLNTYRAARSRLMLRYGEFILKEPPSGTFDPIPFRPKSDRVDSVRGRPAEAQVSLLH